jgi:acylphosphatase
MSGEHICRQARISGRVHMVWFRAWTVGEAEKRGISGWVRNRKDGSVEALFSGAADAVEAMISACREGPPKARVTEIAVQPAQAPDAPGFHQLATE